MLTYSVFAFLRVSPEGALLISLDIGFPTALFNPGTSEGLF